MKLSEELEWYKYHKTCPTQLMVTKAQLLEEDIEKLFEIATDLAFFREGTHHYEEAIFKLDEMRRMYEHY